MQTQSFDSAREAFAFIESLDGFHSIDGVTRALDRSLGLFGLDNFILTGLPTPEQRFEQLVILQQWPTGWFELYARNDYVRVDPVIRMCGMTVDPFEWDEAPYDPELEPRAAEVMKRAAEHGMVRGFCVPIHLATGYGACLSMSGVHPDLSSRNKPAIHLMALYVFARARKIIGRNRLATAVH
jgi:LuxR family transcriptional regulator, quorum-sensing system regulator BjaR1